MINVIYFCEAALMFNSEAENEQGRAAWFHMDLFSLRQRRTYRKKEKMCVCGAFVCVMSEWGDGIMALICML